MSGEHEHAGHGHATHGGGDGSNGAGGGHGADAHHVVPLRVYFTIFFALMALTGITVWVSKVDLGALNTVVALTVAVIKATLVVLFFMHVKYVGKLTQVFVVAGFVWLLILFAFTCQDFISRPWLPV